MTIVVEFPQMRDLPIQALSRIRDPFIKAVRFVATATALRGEITLTRPGKILRIFQLDDPLRLVVDLTSAPPGAETEVTPDTTQPRVVEQERVAQLRVPAEEAERLPAPTEPAERQPVPGTPQQVEGEGPPPERAVTDTWKRHTARARSEPWDNFWVTFGASRQAGLQLGPVILHPALSITAMNDDNIFLTETGTEDDVITALRPSVMFALPWRAQRFRLGYKAEIFFFAENEKENTVNHAISADVNFRFLPGLRLWLRDHYLDTHDPSTSEAQSRTGDPRTPRTQNDAELGVGYSVSPKTDLELVLLRADHHYGRERDDALNHTVHTASLMASNQVFPKTSVVLRYRFRHTDFSDLEPTELDKDNHTHAGFAGVRFDPTAKVVGTLLVGYAGKFFEADSEPDGRPLENETAVTADASVEWTPRPKTAMRFSLTRDIEESSTDGASSFNSTRVGLRLHQHFLLSFTAEISAAYQRDDFNGLDRRDDLWQGKAVMRFALRQWVQFALGYEYARRDSRDANFDFTVNRFWVGVSSPGPSRWGRPLQSGLGY